MNCRNRVLLKLVYNYGVNKELAWFSCQINHQVVTDNKILSECSSTGHGQKCQEICDHLLKDHNHCLLQDHRVIVWVKIFKIKQFLEAQLIQWILPHALWTKRVIIKCMCFRYWCLKSCNFGKKMKCLWFSPSPIYTT